MAHVLFVYKQFPAPSVGHAGGESLFGLMEALHRRGHRLTLATRIAQDELMHMPPVEAICQHLYTAPHHRALPGPRPLAIARSYVMLRRAAQRALCEVQPDLVHVETTQSALALLGVRRPPTSLRTQDVNWFLQRQLAARSHGITRIRARAMAALMRWVEPWLYRRYDLMLAISEGDRRLLAPHVDGRDGRPLLLLPLAPAVHPTDDVVPAVPPGPNLLFVGAMSRNHNDAGVRWFMAEVWPRIHAQIPDARFYVVGRGPSDDLRASARGAGCEITGFVDELAPWYRSAAVFVSPLLVAGGLLQKVLDAMAMGVPVVATSVCNHGVGATPDEHLLTADTPEAFAAAVVHLLRDPEARRRIGAAGQRFVRAHYDIAPAIARWERALLELLPESEGEPEHLPRDVGPMV